MDPIGEASDVKHIWSFKNIGDVSRIPSLIDSVLEGAKAAGMMNLEDGFIFVR